VARVEAYLHAKFHLDPFNHFATEHQRYRQRDRTGQDRQDRNKASRFPNGRPKRLNRLRCCLGYGLGWVQELYALDGVQMPAEGALLRGMTSRFFLPHAAEYRPQRPWISPHAVDQCSDSPTK